MSNYKRFKFDDTEDNFNKIFHILYKNDILNINDLRLGTSQSPLIKTICDEFHIKHNDKYRLSIARFIRSQYFRIAFEQKLLEMTNNTTQVHGKMS